MGYYTQEEVEVRNGEPVLAKRAHINIVKILWFLTGFLFSVVIGTLFYLLQLGAGGEVDFAECLARGIAAHTVLSCFAFIKKAFNLGLLDDDNPLLHGAFCSAVIVLGFLAIIAAIAIGRGLLIFLGAL